MPILLLRISRRRESLTLVMSSPSISSSPAVGSLSRLIIRSTVDLPEPERPITTNISPVPMEKLTSAAPR